MEREWQAESTDSGILKRFDERSINMWHTGKHTPRRSTESRYSLVPILGALESVCSSTRVLCLSVPSTEVQVLVWSRELQALGWCVRHAWQGGCCLVLFTAPRTGHPISCSPSPLLMKFQPRKPPSSQWGRGCSHPDCSHFYGDYIEVNLKAQQQLTWLPHGLDVYSRSLRWKKMVSFFKSWDLRRAI